jgi:flavin-dependent dehydrogenase
MNINNEYDVVIIGAGLAGLSLCRQLLLSETQKKILLIDNKPEIPGKKQKVGESLVQVGGYYFSKVLDLEEHLFNHQYLKYNLRFYWKTRDTNNQDFENYSQSFIRPLSNICSYQLDRNVLERHLFELNSKDSRVDLCHPISALEIELSKQDRHHIRFDFDGKTQKLTTEWLVDTSGRGQILKRKQKSNVESAIKHGSSWCWVEGLIDIEKLTKSSLSEIRKKKDRREQGMIPLWLATNHFMGEGFWFWVIPLQGMTSLGVVYDKALFPEKDVASAEQLIEWACREFPLFQRDLPERRIVDSARFLSYAYDCRQTISPAKWAMSGMAGRFTDPLYSPGSDLIAFYNSMVVDAILTDDQAALEEKSVVFEALMKVFYEAYVPSYAISYDALGDQQVFTLKYAWELSIYFSFYVFPFINDFFTHLGFIQTFFRKFAQLGPINRNLQTFLSSYYQWRKSNGLGGSKVLNDFMELTPLKTAETAFYEVGVNLEEAERILDDHLGNLKEFARFIYAYISSQILEDESVILNRAFVKSIKLKSFDFDPESIRENYRKCRTSDTVYKWKLDPHGMRKFAIQTELAQV